MNYRKPVFSLKFICLFLLCVFVVLLISSAVGMCYVCDAFGRREVCWLAHDKLSM